jgi:HSP20 family protein
MKHENENKAVAPRERVELLPPVDIYDEGDKIVLLADMPGVGPDALDIQYERGQLTIHGRQAEPRTEGQPVLGEFEVGDYRRTFAVGEEVDPAGITAELKHGVLRLNLAKVEARKSQKITVKVK